MRRLRAILLPIFGCVFTFVITIVHILLRVLCLLPFPKQSHLLSDFKMSLRCTTQPKLESLLQILLNCTLSLMSALAISNYCEWMLGMAEWVSHRTHLVFLSLVLPRVPDLATLTPPSVVLVYLLLGYLGLTAQLSFTLDLLWLYNLPAILIYKLLALSYSRLLSAISLCLKVLSYDHTRWFTCEYPWILRYRNIAKSIGYGLTALLLQVLLIVGFYYVWLVFVITVLFVFMVSLP